MKYSIIIPVAKKDSRFLKRCLLSLKDQDYSDWEAIVVSDGFKCERPLEYTNINYFNIEKEGASYARNYGAEHATGDYLLFFDVDCVLFPGMLTLIADRFTRYNPDFVYSGYRFNHSSLSVYPSRPFNPYLLESMNYICTMSPMKREVFDAVCGFRKDLEYLQDWDFWLRVVKLGYKGHYLKDFMFQTEVPNPLSITGNPKWSWEEKVKTIYELNGIAKRDVCVTTLTAPTQAIERAQLLNAKYLGIHEGSSLCQLPSQFPSDVSTVIMQGFFPLALEQHVQAFPQDCKKVINWIGTDVWQLRNKFNWENIKEIKGKFLADIDLHLCNSPSLQEELAELGIKADVVYQPLTKQVTQTKFPKKPTVSAYCSDGHPMHNEFFFKDLAQSMPDVNFIIFGSKLENTQVGNILYRGWIPIQEAIDMSTIHLRLTAHDGFPHTPIYFAMAGRHVLTNYNLHYCDYIEGQPNESTWERMKSTAISYIRSNLHKPIKYDLCECEDYYNDLCNPRKYVKIMNEKIGELHAKNDSSVAELQQPSIPCPDY